MHLSRNIINIIIMIKMRTNIAIAFATLTKTFLTITKIWTPIFTSAALTLAFIGQFRKFWSVL